MKNITTAGLLALLIAMSISMGTVSAYTWNVTTDNSTADIQGVIDNANPGDTISFTNATGSKTYNNFAVTVTKDNLTFKGNGAKLVGNGTSIFTITNRHGLTIKNFRININDLTADGITGSGVYNTTIKHNTITNGDDAINIFQHYGGLKILYNKIKDMSTGRDGISLVNRNVTDDLNSIDPTYIIGNKISSVDYGIFLGGNFKGYVIGNTVTANKAALNMTGKPTATNGKVNATICHNTLNGGIAMESPYIIFLKICYNTITELIGEGVNSTGYSIYDVAGTYNQQGNVVEVTNNNFTNPVFDVFRWGATVWDNNYKNGTLYPQFP